MSNIYDNEYDFWARIRCWTGIHTPRVYWMKYPDFPKGKGRGKNEGCMYFWTCLHCSKIIRGGYITTEYYKNGSWADINNPIPVRNIHLILRENARLKY